MTRVHILGAAGYGAFEMMRLVRRHPHLELGALESASHAGEPLAAHAPLLRDYDGRFSEVGSVFAAVHPDDVVVCAGNGEKARAWVPEILARGARAVDLSDGFRLHAAAGDAVYGLPERYRARIAAARLIANPGCYPTATLLGLLPLAPFAREIVAIALDAKSGVTGAGRTPKTGNLYAEVADDVHVYGFGGHRHEPEIAQELAAVGIAAPLTFTPQVVPVVRGMLVNAYVFTDAPLDDDALHAAYVSAYGESPFVRVLDAERAPSLPALARTNRAEIHVSRRGRVVRVLSAIDNLGKGAAGQAMQNINLMLGLPETTALE